jgi:hypothetical protein
LATLAVYFYLTAKNAKNRKGFLFIIFFSWRLLATLAVYFYLTAKSAKDYKY